MNNQSNQVVFIIINKTKMQYYKFQNTEASFIVTSWWWIWLPISTVFVLSTFCIQYTFEFRSSYTCVSASNAAGERFHLETLEQRIVN